MLKQAFPQAEVIGLDLSPYMLVRAEDKAKQLVWTFTGVMAMPNKPG